jgi:GT2 family glycosyltransferase
VADDTSTVLNGDEPQRPARVSTPRHKRPDRISVIVPCHNPGPLLDQQLDALAAQVYSGSWEVILVDNRGSDGAVERAAAWTNRLPGLRRVNAPDRAGVSHARNVGVGAATGDFVAICDADDIVDRHWLEGLADAARTGDVVGGLNLPFWVVPGDAPTKARHVEDPFKFLPYASGCNFGAWRTVVDQLGGWCEDYVAGADDVEFSWRAQLAGYSLHLTDAAIVNYRMRREMRSRFRQSLNYERMNSLLFRNFRDRGVPRRRLGVGRQIAFVLTRLPYLVLGRRRRLILAGAAGKVVGRIQGAIRYGQGFP